MLIPAVCKALEAEHLPVFKRKGKLFTGPARPLALPVDAVLAERPGKMVEWIRANKPAKLEGLWLAVLPEGGTAPPAEYAADLFWMLQQGHILLFTDDTLVVQEPHEPTPPAKKKAKRKKPAPPQPKDSIPSVETTNSTESSDSTESSESIATSEIPVTPDTPEPPEAPEPAVMVPVQEVSTEALDPVEKTPAPPSRQSIDGPSS